MSIVKHPTIGAADGLNCRAVLADSTTQLSIHVTYDGANATLSSVTVQAATGDTIVTLTHSVSAGVITYSVTPANLEALGLTKPGDTFEVSVQCSVAGYTNLVRWKERIYVSHMIVLCPVDHAHVVEQYAELSDVDNMPAGETTWDSRIAMVWRATWNELERTKQGVAMHRVVDPQSLYALVLHRVLHSIAMYLAVTRVSTQTVRGGSDSYWSGVAEFHKREATTELEQLKLTYREGYGETFQTETNPSVRAAKPPFSFAGNARPASTGRL